MSHHSSPLQVDPDRLHGWKEISAFVGKGVRTVQRWEKQYGLPVRRLRDGSEIVFASKKELEAWLLASSSQTSRDMVAEGEAVTPTSVPAEPGRETPQNETVTAASEANASTFEGGGGAVVPASATLDAVFPEAERTPGGSTAAPAPVARRRGWSKWLFGVVAISLVGIVGVGVRMLSGSQSRVRNAPRTAGAPKPDNWEVDGRFLRVFDQRGLHLWSHEFDEELLHTSYAAQPADMSVITDLDGDGPPEVLFVAHSTPSYPHRTQLIALNSDGTERFHHSTAPTVRFGANTFVPPWITHMVRVTTDGAGRKAVWAISIHSPYFPSVVERLDPVSGDVLSTYWSAGYITGVWRITWRGQPTTAIGATNNDFKAATLALFPADEVNGTSPAATEKYRCLDCQAGTPMEFIVLPASCLWAARGGHPTVMALATDSTGALQVAVNQGLPMPNVGRPIGGALVYTLDSDLRLRDIDTSQEFDVDHARARQAGQIDHDFGPADDRWLLPLLRWDGKGFTPLEPAPQR